MMVKVISTIIVVFLFIVFNLKDFDNVLNHGEDEFIQRENSGGSAVIATFLFIMFLLELYGVLNLASLFITYIIYFIAYTVIFFKLKKIRDDKEVSKFID